MYLCRFTKEPMGVSWLATMLPRVCRAAGTEIYTNHCLRSTMVQTLSDAGLEAREIMSVSGHKCESSLQSYWRPNVTDRKRWSDILAGTDVNVTPGPAVKRRTETGDISSEPEQMGHFFSGCTINGSIQINVNKAS